MIKFYVHFSIHIISQLLIIFLPFWIFYFFAARQITKKVVKKVKFIKTRSSPRLRAPSSQPAEVVDLEEQPTATSPVAVPEACVTGSSPPSEADAVADLSQSVAVEAAEQLAAAATITVVVEELAAAVVNDEAGETMQADQFPAAETGMHEDHFSGVRHICFCVWKFRCDFSFFRVITYVFCPSMRCSPKC